MVGRLRPWTRLVEVPGLEEQRVQLFQTAFDYYLADCKWPELKILMRELVDRFDAEEVAEGLEYPWVEHRAGKNNPLELRVAAIAKCRGSEEIAVTADPLTQTRLVGVSTPLRATATDTGTGAAAIERVDFFVDGAFLADDSTRGVSGLYEVAWETLLEPGLHTLSAVSIDRAGNPSGVYTKEIVVIADVV